MIWKKVKIRYKEGFNMKNKIKKIFIILVSYVPLNFIRIFMYKLLGYKIGKNVKIGFKTVLLSKDCEIGDYVEIAKSNYIEAKKIYIGSRTRIGKYNKIVAWASYSRELSNSNYIYIGKECLITEGHLLDGSFGFSIGDRTWIAGRNSSFWSHGSTHIQGPIKIGDKCYIGSDVKMGTNITIGDEVLIAMGSTVLKGCPSRCLIAGSPSTIKKRDYIWHKHWK